MMLSLFAPLQSPRTHVKLLPREVIAIRTYRIIRGKFVSPRYSSPETIVDEIQSDTYIAIEDNVRTAIEKNLRRISEFKDYNSVASSPMHRVL